MKWYVAVLAAGFASAAVAAEDDAKADLAKLDGSWEIVAIEAGGMKMDARKGAPEKAVVREGKATFFTDGKEIPTFKDMRLDLDPKKTPRSVDLVRNEKESLPCIYEIKGDEWKIAMPLVPKKAQDWRETAATRVLRLEGQAGHGHDLEASQEIGVC